MRTYTPISYWEEKPFHELFDDVRICDKIIQKEKEAAENEVKEIGTRKQ
jgi:hypothetical protein